MGSLQQFYINGQWVAPADGASSHTVINPATEDSLGELATDQ